MFHSELEKEKKRVVDKNYDLYDKLHTSVEKESDHAMSLLSKITIF